MALRFEQRYRGKDVEPPQESRRRLDAPVLHSLVVTVLTDEAGTAKQLEADESYSLRVGAAGGAANLTAPSLWGALYGLETFTQLVAFDVAAERHVLRNATVAIDDAPRFAWRGLMVDTANHFLPMPLLLQTVDTMAMNRMNVLHLHIVDSYSFPFASAALPLLAAKGAWAPDKVYTPADLQALVAHARTRGVRVVPELDMPGHAYSWGLGYPELTSPTCPADVARDLGEINVRRGGTVPVVQKLAREVLEICRIGSSDDTRVGGLTHAPGWQQYLDALHRDGTADPDGTDL